MVEETRNFTLMIFFFSFYSFNNFLLFFAVKFSNTFRQNCSRKLLKKMFYLFYTKNIEIFPIFSSIEKGRCHYDTWYLNRYCFLRYCSSLLFSLFSIRPCLRPHYFDPFFNFLFFYSFTSTLFISPWVFLSFLFIICTFWM